MLDVRVEKRRGDFSLAARFEAPAPAVVALFGPSGCGKTTLVNLVAGLIAPDAGRIALDGEVLCDTESGISVPPERRRLGYVFQDSRLFPHLDVRGNLEYGRKRTRAAAGQPTLDDVASLLGLGSLLHRKPLTLSGGERQRVALGRALLSNPRLLLLDEPLASLDALRREEVMPYLETLRDRWRVPILYVSHQLDEVIRLATHVVLLDRGRVVASGPLTSVTSDPALGRVAGEATVGAVIDSTVASVEDAGSLARVRVGRGELTIVADGLKPGSAIRLQILARDVIVATARPENISVRNRLEGIVTAVTGESPHSDLVTIDVGGTIVVARVTHAASRELALAGGQRVWALVKAVSVRPASGAPAGAPTSAS